MYSFVKEKGTATYRDDIEKVSISAPAENCLGLIDIREPPVLAWPEDFRAAFSRPLGTPSLRQLARGVKRVAVIVSDSTRGIPTSAVMPMVLEELAAAGILPGEVTVVIATGVHRPATFEEIREIVGSDHVNEVKVINHDPWAREKLAWLGETSYGTPVEINRTVFEADLKIVIGKVEPHEFAGFSGGRKSVLPGVASERAIQFNHRPEMLISPHACPGQLDGNPIHLDMVEAAEMLGVQFTVNLVLNQAGEAVGIFTGGLKDAHQAAVRFMRTFCQISLPERPDVVVTTPGRPLNIDFYQSIKPLIALAPVMAPGGALVLYSSCRDGLGTKDMLVPYQGARNIEDVISHLKSGYKIQMDHALLLAKILQKEIHIIVAAPSVDSAVLDKMFLTSAPTPQEALNRAMEIVRKPKPSLLFFPQSQRALTVLE
ncbi:MAG: nickel-dependent lactate racemase [Desulfuromonadaceae bacterium]|nr:nickel-dependent lactate racemase [Desulfuromonadaceae bacterium]